MALSLGFMHRVDRYLGGLLVTALQPFNLRRYFGRVAHPDPLTPERVLVIKFWGIGSIALAGPTLAALRARYPQARVHFLTLESNRAFLEFVPQVDEVIALDIRGGPFAVFGRILKLLTGLRRRRFDLVVDLEFFTRFSALVTFLTRAPVRVGFHAWEVWRGNFTTTDVPFNRYYHVTQNFFHLAQAAGVAGDVPPDFRLATGEREASEVDAVLREAGVQAGERLVLINANAGGLALERRWPPAQFAALAREVADQLGCRPVFIGAPSEQDYVKPIAAEAGDRAVNLAGRLSIGGLIRLFESAQLLVTNDSGPLQLALTQGLSTVSLFGPETPVLYGPRSGRNRAIYLHLSCSPCMNVHTQKQVRCIHGRPICLEGISIDRVLTEVRALLAADEEQV